MEFRRVLFRSKDDAGFPIYAADLHQSWRFRGGPTAADIYRRLRTGLDGTPMPSFSDLIDQKFLTDEQLWRLAQYVRSLSPAETPDVRDVIHAAQIAGALPAAPRSEEHTSELQSPCNLVCRLLLEKKKSSRTEC